ncbi:E3 ubiquitin-protein ligase RNF31 [Aquarana catesbeiana]|uniref:E3 ubiquitin-protein ligase RNF31 n=1 Tax=Aquarana catesbeiana TaxID=8400 RepID=UPI003CC9419C
MSLLGKRKYEKRKERAGLYAGYIGKAMANEQLRDVLELALINEPEAVTMDLLDKMFKVPFRERYRRLDLPSLLSGGAQGPALRSVITALNILEKYGKNLLSPNRPKFWRSVKFNNPVFKTTVDAVEGGRHVLSLYGYTHSLPDGLSFPDSVAEPDTTEVAAVTADVLILHRELNLLISNSHPHQDEAAQELLGAKLPQPSFVTDAIPFTQPHSSDGISAGCCLCGVKNVSVVCTSCNETLCLACDQRVHSHPNRSHHLRSPYGISTTHRLKEEEFISHLSSRPPWECMTCSTLNKGGSVLCITCKRPRGCNNIMSSMLQETSLQKDIWECQACTLQNPSSAVLCAVCDRPRLARKPSRENAESTVSSKDGTDTRDRYKTMPLPQKTSPLLTEKEIPQSFAFGNKMESVERANQTSRIYGAEDIGAFPKKDSLDNTYTSEKSINDPIHSLRSSLANVAESSKGSLEQGIKVRKLEGWECSHCTFYNKHSGRVCEMCDRTSGVASPAGDKKILDAHRQLLNQEAMRQKQLKEDGVKLVALIKEGEAHGVSPEEVYSTVQYSGTEVPLGWLQTELPYVLERVIEAAQKAAPDLGAFTAEEARTAWVASGGDMEDAVHLCIIQRRSKVEELCTLGFQNRDNVVAALFETAGDVGRALCTLQKTLLEPFLQRVWEDTEVPLQLDSKDKQALLRRLLAEHSLHSWGRAELALSLLQEGEGRFSLQDVVEAVRESQDRDFIKRMLTQECAVCGWELPRNKMRSLTSCECCICPDCFRMHFTVAVKEKHIRDMVCPACEEPEISDEGELLHYFSTLDILLRDTLDVDAYDLFHKKLTERTLMKDPKFLWCTHCSFGFIYERDQLDVKCPQCKCSFCRNCKRLWEEQHRNLSCEDFQNWKRENDAEYQAQGLAVYLQENGITCPHCKFSYALARGGCMHFICSQCRHQFCSGCYNTFHPKNKCTVQSCTVRMSLHAHHPRDCLFYLRDWEVPRLQRLLTISNVQFNTDPPTGTQAGPGGGCRVMEQKETLDGMKDEACGKQTAVGYAGLCESHYKEYLVSRINALFLDPCILYDLEEVVTVCKRYLPGCPPKEEHEDEATYKSHLIQVLMTEIPLNLHVQRSQHP